MMWKYMMVLEKLLKSTNGCSIQRSEDPRTAKNCRNTDHLQRPAQVVKRECAGFCPSVITTRRMGCSGYVWSNWGLISLIEGLVQWVLIGVIWS